MLPDNTRYSRVSGVLDRQIPLVRPESAEKLPKPLQLPSLLACWGEQGLATNDVRIPKSTPGSDMPARSSRSSPLHNWHGRVFIRSSCTHGTGHAIPEPESSNILITPPRDDDLWSVVNVVGQSPPVDCSKPYDPSALAGKTILITGGASGLGAAFARRWASHGAHVVIGDIDDRPGEELVAELRSSSPSAAPGQVIAYQHCDVTSWTVVEGLVETFVSKYLAVLNLMRQVKGWVGFVRDLFGGLFSQEGEGEEEV
ncbi:uncharacterized protein P884DRAFT_266873 [Thermothelomyces heterothallicus CBS 202.75]|uniref:uncharacterized protein n=1 Tax=Thermothelomyces heterothallicus CBS 202.75 TaxID=1149848 RepID=UPI0037439EA9